jgi:hypothetical protein
MNRANKQTGRVKAGTVADTGKYRSRFVNTSDTGTLESTDLVKQRNALVDSEDELSWVIQQLQQIMCFSAARRRNIFKMSRTTLIRRRVAAP